MPSCNNTEPTCIESPAPAHHEAGSASLLISKPLAIKLARLLAAFSTPSTYTDGPRTGGVLAGCPRGPKPTVERLATIVRIVRDEFNQEIEARRGLGS